ncbi:mannos-6-phosphate isomerase [Dacryopinax primogenitus]|uniref:Mannose-6-phosphate isomerase n=1 Tax=Dacryopinax primogenitus (strain DJM 731) TaxID=1858805 RepID=M5GF53_DACPD|nr:mannos-6-phosphate isomerase [Dacryopinax primogenitus]EJU05977.1 mannos-6-phosphate isomerase [Dacryopinax primogenitus]
MSSVFQLRAGVQSYDWGKLGSSSKAAEFAALTGLDVSESTPYAELWMGTHPSCPSSVLPSGPTLLEHIRAHPELLGKNVQQHFGDDVPFLFKVLAIRKALSIQAHPDKALAQRLHRDKPEWYKDGNHKPEMAIALTPFSGFCGFLPPHDIQRNLTLVPEFSALIAAPAREAFLASPAPGKDLLKAVFKSLMEAPESEVRKWVGALVQRYREGSDVKDEEKGVQNLAIILDSQFPGDIGIMCVFVLNVVHLNPGEAVFLKANDPHAYIDGDIIECMATSDNVVRAGLTPKVRDVPTLVNMLTYETAPASEQLLPPQPFRNSKHSLLYDPPIEEFGVLLTRLAEGETDAYGAIDGPSIIIVTDGAGELAAEGKTQEISIGQVWFVGADVDASFKGTKGELVLYRAFAVAP